MMHKKQYLLMRLKNELRSLGVEKLLPLYNGYAFSVFTEANNKLRVITEMNLQSLTMFTILNEEFDPEDEDIASAIAEFFHRINSKLNIGCFKINCDDGSIIYNISIPFYERFPESEVFSRSLRIICTMADRFIPGIHEVLDGSVTAKEAVNECLYGESLESYIRNKLSEIFQYSSAADPDLTDLFEKDLEDREDEQSSEPDNGKEVSINKSLEEFLKRLREKREAQDHD